VTATRTSGYEGRIGRYTPQLAEALVAVAEVRPGERVLDVGCGTGPLAARLAEIVGPENVCAVDPSSEAIAVCGERLPGIEARVASAEALPYEEGAFDATLAQLVVGLMADAEQGAREMRRVTRRRGRVATCVWDFGGGMTVLRTFWDAAASINPPAARQHDHAKIRPYSTAEELDALWRSAGIREVSTGALVVSARYADFEDLWDPLAVPDGPSGKFLQVLDARQRAAVKRRVRTDLGSPVGAFRLDARAWYAVGYA
jgi:ubiquinone/menaquinone biosynthesis C-methylase UbiE